MSLPWRPLPEIDDAWQAEVVRHGVPLRATAFRLRDGRLGVVSPVKGLGDDAHAGLAALGAPALLLAPNHFHHLGLREYAAAFPGVAVVASERAAPRVRAKTGLAVTEVAGGPAGVTDALPAGASILVPPRTRNGELWVSLRPGERRAWIVGDAFFNISRTPRSAMGLLLRALGISPGLRIGSSFRWLVADRPAYRRWLLDKIAEERPTALIPCHGDVLVDQTLPERLKALVEQRL